MTAAVPRQAARPAAAGAPTPFHPDASRDDQRRAGSSTTGARDEVDAIIARLAERQHGVVARWQLLAAGISPDAIEHRRRTHRLHGLRPPIAGTYLVGHRVPPPFAHETAALLACRGRHVALSSRSSAAVWGFAEASTERVDLVQVGGNASRLAPLRVVVLEALPADHVRTRHRLRLLSPARTCLELAGDGSFHEIATAIDRARVLRLLQPSELDDMVRWARGRRGVRALREVLDAERDDGFSRSGAERTLRRLLADAGLPQPARNVLVLGRERDLVWVEARIVVEFDSRRYHLTPERWEDDHERDAQLVAGGWQTFRVTWRMLQRRPLEVAARAAAILARATPDGPPARGR
jgi:very-short-patch-repair endonuclease